MHPSLICELSKVYLPITMCSQVIIFSYFRNSMTNTPRRKRGKDRSTSFRSIDQWHWFWPFSSGCWHVLFLYPLLNPPSWTSCFIFVRKKKMNKREERKNKSTKQLSGNVWHFFLRQATSQRNIISTIHPPSFPSFNATKKECVFHSIFMSNDKACESSRSTHFPPFLLQSTVHNAGPVPNNQYVPLRLATPYLFETTWSIIPIPSSSPMLHIFCCSTHTFKYSSLTFNALRWMSESFYIFDGRVSPRQLCMDGQEIQTGSSLLRLPLFGHMPPCAFELHLFFHFFLLSKTANVFFYHLHAHLPTVTACCLAPQSLLLKMSLFIETLCLQSVTT